MQIALQNQGAFDRSRAEPRVDKVAEQCDAITDVVEKATESLANAGRCADRRKLGESLGHIEDVIHALRAVVGSPT